MATRLLMLGVHVEIEPKEDAKIKVDFEEAFETGLLERVDSLPKDEKKKRSKQLQVEGIPQHIVGTTEHR